MAEKGQETPSSLPRATSTTPDDYLTSASSQLPSGDYSYTVELVGTIQNQLGRLTEAVEVLKGQSKEHGDELRTVSRDIHAAKVVVSVVGGLIILIGGIIAWLVKTYISTQAAQ